MLFQPEARAEQSVEAEMRGKLACNVPAFLVAWDLTAGVIRSGRSISKLRTHHLRALVDFVGQENALQSHDVPEHIREQLCWLNCTE